MTPDDMTPQDRTPYDTTRQGATKTGAGQTALITGAAIRVGAALAEALAADGWHVAINYHSSHDQAAALLARIKAGGGRGHLVPGDLRDHGVVEGLIAAAGRDAPPLGLLVNNASLFENDSALNMNLQSWNDHQAINLRALPLQFDYVGLEFNAQDQTLWASTGPQLFKIDPVGGAITYVGDFGKSAVNDLALHPDCP